MARRKVLGLLSESEFTEEILKGSARDLKSRRLRLDRMTFSDDVVTGLRAMVTKTGLITFHVSYHLGDRRRFLIIGELTDDKKNPARLTVQEARDIARTVLHLAQQLGIDPQDGLHRRLISELKHDGIKWRPQIR